MARKTDADPTGQRVNRARTTRRLSAKLEIARREIMVLFRRVPRSRRQVKKIVNESQVVYDYDLTPEQSEALQADIRRIIDEQLLETRGDTMPPGWWYQPEVELPTRQGTLEELIQFNQLIALAITLGMTGLGGIPPQRITPEMVLSSRQYLASLRNVYMENFQVIKTLSDQTASQTIRVINTGIRVGSTPTDIAKDINERFDVSKSNAKRISNTEVNRAYTDAKLRATKTAGDISGLRSAVRHISALKKTTRPSHAARHGKVFSVEDQRIWWDSGSNRINCFCSVKSVLIDKNGDIISSN